MFCVVAIQSIKLVMDCRIPGYDCSLVLNREKMKLSEHNIVQLKIQLKIVSKQKIGELINDVTTIL